MTNLRRLHATSDSGISNDGIQALVNLEVLCVNHNSKVFDVNHLTNLRVLHATCDRYDSLNCGIDNSGLSKLSGLTELYVYCNRRVYDVNFMTQLRVLNVGGTCGMTYDGLKELRCLEELDAQGNDTVCVEKCLANLPN